MSIKHLKIENFKSLKNNSVNFCLPDGVIKGSGLNIFIGENNTGKSSVFEILKKIKKPIIDKEEINYIAQENKKEVVIEILDSEDRKICFESKYFLEQDPDNKIYISEQGFTLDLYHSNTNRKLEKNTAYNNVSNVVYQSKHEDEENKSDNYQIIQEIYKLDSLGKDDFCNVINQFLPEIKRVYVKTDRRQNRATLACKLMDDTEIDLRDMGSGIEQFIILLWIIKFSTIKTLIIDEPEISLHPKAQIKLAELLMDSSRNKQIIIATHSPYIFKNCLDTPCGLFIFKKNKNTTKIIDFRNPKNKKLFPWSPSWGEINYYAYDFFTVEFHNELYGYIHSELVGSNKSIKDLDDYLIQKGDSVLKWKKDNGNLGYSSASTYIRMCIHHPEQKGGNRKYKDNELIKSTNFLIKLISA